MINLFEEALQYSVAYKVRNRFTRLLWVLKLLTLDQPGDIRRIQLSTEIFPVGQDDSVIREVLARRVDFSVEGISKAKIVWEKH